MILPFRLLAAPRRRLVATAVVVAAGLSSPWAANAAQTAPVTPSMTLPDFTELIEKVGPAVVNIRTLESASAPSGGALELDPNIEEFFRRFGIPLPRQPQPGQRPPRAGEGDEEPRQRGIGSGFILSADGYVMTNAHVVEGADEVIVTLTDQRELKARIVGTDTRTDVAVVKVEASALPFVKIGDASRVKVGEWVVAIGSPFGLDNTVTAGIVSAKQRDTGNYLPFIQTDVAVNPGNSGGPLLNMRGEVIGINSQIYSRSGGFMGISFAIPIDEAMRIADQLRATGHIVRGRIGVLIGPVSKEVAEAIGLASARGALVQSVEKGGPADKGGIEAGDVIVSVDGKTVDKSGDLPRMVGANKPGSKSELKVFRRGQTRELTLTVGEFEADKPSRRAQGEPAPATASAALGLTVSDLTPAQRSELDVRGGVRVDGVGGMAARAGVHEGDVILAINNNEVTGSKQFLSLAARAEKERSVSLLVRRGEVTNYLVIRPNR